MLKEPTVPGNQSLRHSLLRIAAGMLAVAALLCAALSLTSAGYSSSSAAQTVDALEQKHQSEAGTVSAAGGKESTKSARATSAVPADAGTDDGKTVLDPSARVPLYGAGSDSPANGSSSSTNGGSSSTGGDGISSTGGDGSPSTGGDGSPSAGGNNGNGGGGNTAGSSVGTPVTGGNGGSPSTGGGSTGSGPLGEYRVKSACFGGDGHCYADR